MAVAYLIVIFTDDDETALIPTNWLQDGGETCAWWPPYKTSLRVTNAARCKEPPSSTWSALPIRVLYKSESYEKARAMLKRSEEESDLQTEDETQKRKRRAPNRLSDSSDDESMPVVRRKSAAARTLESACGTSYDLPPPPARRLQLCSSPPPTLGMPVQSPPLALEPADTPRTPTPRLDHIRDARVFTILETMMEELKLHRSLLHQVLGGQAMSAEGVALPEGISFPIDAVADMERVDEMLSNTENYSTVIQYLSMFGGQNVKETVCRILKEVVTSSLARQYNLLGHKGKLGFGKYRIVAVLFRCLQRNSATKHSTRKEMEDEVKKWLTGARDRDGGRDKRNQPVAEPTDD